MPSCWVLRQLLLLLFGLTILANIIKFRMIERKKWSLLLFHSAIIIILIGAGVTRYLGFEGMMHIRENNTSNRFFSSNTYLKFKVIKNDATFESPYGTKRILYGDWIASGRLYEPIEQKLQTQFGPFVANTHSESTLTGTLMKSPQTTTAHMSSSFIELYPGSGKKYTRILTWIWKSAHLKVLLAW